jgi:hypothetical protein
MTYSELIANVPTDKREIVDAFLKGVAEGCKLSIVQDEQESKDDKEKEK